MHFNYSKYSQVLQLIFQFRNVNLILQAFRTAGHVQHERLRRPTTIFVRFNSTKQKRSRNVHTYGQEPWAPQVRTELRKTYTVASRSRFKIERSTVLPY
jgi:hypothetical protein